MYDGDQLVCEFDGSANLKATNVWGANGLLARQSGGTTTGFLWDDRGNIAQALNANGTIAVNFNVTSWGDVARDVQTNGAYFGLGGQFGNYLDVETGLLLCGQRYYDSSTGRWINRDPIDYDGGLNVYGYVENNPTNYGDEDGLRKKTFQIYLRYPLGPVGGKPYVGRAGGFGTPQQNVDKRYSSPKEKAKMAGYGPPRIWWSGTSYSICRGLEDRLIKKYGGAWRHGGTSNNKNRGIDPRRKAATARYYRASSKVWKGLGGSRGSRGGGGVSRSGPSMGYGGSGGPPTVGAGRIIVGGGGGFEAIPGRSPDNNDAN